MALSFPWPRVCGERKVERSERRICIFLKTFLTQIAPNWSVYWQITDRMEYHIDVQISRSNCRKPLNNTENCIPQKNPKLEKVSDFKSRLGLSELQGCPDFLGGLDCLPCGVPESPLCHHQPRWCSISSKSPPTPRLPSALDFWCRRNYWNMSSENLSSQTETSPAGEVNHSCIAGMKEVCW